MARYSKNVMDRAAKAKPTQTDMISKLVGNQVALHKSLRVACCFIFW